MSESHQHQLQFRNMIQQQRLDARDVRYGHDIPVSIHRGRYHSLYPFEDSNRKLIPNALFGYASTVYKAIRTKDSDYVCIKRFHGCVVANDVSSSALQPWLRLRNNPNLVGVHEVFLCKEFASSGELCFVYDFYPGAISLYDYFITGGVNAGPDLLWSIICQLVCALSSIHGAGLACRVIDLKKVLFTPKGGKRIRISCCGVKDIIHLGGQVPVADYQASDILAVGTMILHLAVKRPVDEMNILKIMEFVDVHYSKEIGSVLRLMTMHRGPDGQRPSVYDISRVLHSRMIREVQNSYVESDLLFNDLAVESQNGRLVRLLAKLLFINERPEFANDPQWSEHGERYPVKLFRDFLFHQVDNSGNPVIDLAQVVHWLNKLDAGVPEKLVLSSRDQSSLIVVGYNDLKRYIDDSFADLFTKKKQESVRQSQSQPAYSVSARPSNQSAGNVSSQLNVNAPDFRLC